MSFFGKPAEDTRAKTPLVYKRNGIVLNNGGCPDFKDGGDGNCIVKPGDCRHRMEVAKLLYTGDLRGILCEKVKPTTEFKTAKQLKQDEATLREVKDAPVVKGPEKGQKSQDPPEKKGPEKVTAIEIGQNKQGFPIIVPVDTGKPPKKEETMPAVLETPPAKPKKKPAAKKKSAKK